MAADYTSDSYEMIVTECARLLVEMVERLGEDYMCRMFLGCLNDAFGDENAPLTGRHVMACWASWHGFDNQPMPPELSRDAIDRRRDWSFGANIRTVYDGMREP